MYSNKMTKNLTIAMITVFFFLIFAFFTAKRTVLGVSTQSATITKYYNKVENNIFSTYVYFLTEHNKEYHSVYHCVTAPKSIGTNVELRVREESLIIIGVFSIPQYILENGETIACSNYKP